MKNKTLKQMERNIEGLCKGAVGEDGRGIYDLSELHELFSQSIKDALESCRVEEGSGDGGKYGDGWDDCADKYEDNVEEFLGEE